MKKVFHLLRDNIQLGPFTIDELLQQKLSSNDLVWVEGYSHAWSHPSEIDLLKLSLAEAAPALDATASPDENKNSFNESENKRFPNVKRKRKWANEDIESRAEEIRRRTLEYVSSKNNSISPIITDDEIKSFAKTPDIDFVVHKKRRGLSANFIGALLVAIMLIAGWYGKDKLFISQSNSNSISGDVPAPQVIPISSTVQLQPSQNESSAYFTEPTNDSLMIQEPDDVPKAYVQTSKPVVQPVTVVSTPDVSKESEEPKNEKLQVKATEVPVKPEKKEDIAVIVKPDSSKTKADLNSDEKEESVEKKKTLGQAIKGIFKKKKKDKDTEDETKNDN